MKRIMLLLIGIGLVMGSCSRDQKNVKLEQGTALYDFAKEIAVKVPELDPDKNQVLVRSKYFTVTVGDFITEMNSAMGKNTLMLKNLSAERAKNFITSHVQRTAEKKLLLQAAKNADVSIEQAELDSVLNLVYAQNGSEAQFLERLAKDSIKIEYVIEDVKSDLIVQKLFKKISEMEIPEEDLKKAYDEDKTATVQHILLMTRGASDSAKAEKRMKMEGILERAKNGEDFSDLAKMYSEDPGSKNSGGLYEDFGRGQMVKPFEDASFSVPPGEISDIVETQYGYHIIKVIERKKETRPFEEAYEDLRQQLMNNKKRDVSNNYVDQLKEEAAFEMSI